MEDSLDQIASNIRCFYDEKVSSLAQPTAARKAGKEAGARPVLAQPQDDKMQSDDKMGDRTKMDHPQQQAPGPRSLGFAAPASAESGTTWEIDLLLHSKTGVESFEAAAMPHLGDLYRTARFLTHDSSEATTLSKTFTWKRGSSSSSGRCEICCSRAQQT